MMEKRVGKRAQIDLSFGFIFGIIIIVVTIAVAFYVISHFLRLSRCSDTGLFYTSLQEQIDQAWGSTGAQKIVSLKMPSEIESVCFGNLTSFPVSDSRTQYEALSKFRGLDKNAFLYPNTKACNVQLANRKFEHIYVNKFFCAKNVNGKVSVYISKSSTDALVNLCKDAASCAGIKQVI